MRKCFLTAIAMAWVLSVTAGTTGAQIILTDSFEDPDITGSVDEPEPTGWFDEGHPNTAGIIDVDTGNFTTPYGSQAAKAWQGDQRGCQRILGILENQVYTVTFNVSKRDNRAVGDYRVELATVDGDGTTVLASVAGAVTTKDMSHGDELVFAPGPGHPELGKQLRLRLVDPAAGQVTTAWQDGPYYDNLQVMLGVVSPPGTVVILR